MKCHTGVGAGSGFVHTVEATAANVRDVTAAAGLLREDDKAVCGDSACLGIEKREEIKSNPQLSAIAYRINRRPGRLPRGSDNAIDRERHIENQKSAVPFPVPGWRPYALHLR
jgi:IS5 family transposase